jgi:uncharacterized iron-regulated membrane protein
MVHVQSTPRAPIALDRRLYFAVWRWHFYAGLYVIPFIAMLAITGLAMLWFTAVAPEYGEFLRVTPQQQALPPSAQAQAALAAHPGSAISKYIAPWDAESPAIIRVASEHRSHMVAVDPYDGSILRDTVEGDTWNELAKTIHGSLLLGDVGDWLIEIAAGFGVILVATGLYLWWPRSGQGIGTMLVPDFASRGRALWKSLHQVTGFWFSLILVFFLISGLSWTGVWGTKLVQAWSTFPAEKWDAVPLSEVNHEHMNHGAEKGVPWALEQTPMPMSGSNAGSPGVPEDSAVTLDAVAALGRSLGFEGRFQIAFPGTGAGVYTLSQDSQSYDSTHPTADRTVHVDQYTGKVLADVRFDDYGLGGKAMAVGIALHEGTMGWWNVALNAIYLLAVLFLVVSGVVMWWKRRPSDAARLGAPPMPAFTPAARTALVLMLVLSLAFPLTAAVLVAVLLLDVLVIQNIRPLAKILS